MENADHYSAQFGSGPLCLPYVNVTNFRFCYCHNRFIELFIGGEGAECAVEPVASLQRTAETKALFEEHERGGKGDEQRRNI